MTQTTAENGNLNLGMHQLIIRERERLGVLFVSGHEIWQDDFTPLTGYEGYATFETSRGWSLLLVNDDSTQKKREQLVECGFEFTSAMKLGALSIGAAAVYGKPGFTDLTELFPSAEAEVFWQNITQAWISLGMASDRLRTFFVRFVMQESNENRLDDRLKQNMKDISKPGDEEPQFVYKEAFRKYEAQFLGDQSRQYLDELKYLVETIADIRRKRNVIIHDYASREAMWIASRRNIKLDHARIFLALNGEIQVEDYLEELSSAYKVLAKSGNIVFLLEKAVAEIY